MQITTSRNPEIPALTGIRALAAWWVALYHIKDGLAVLYPGLAGTIYAAVWAGDLGVDLFFILSGFVIAYNYWPRFLVFRATEYRHFLWMRLARIYPVHVVTLLGVLALYLGSKVLHVHINTDVTNWTASTFVHNLVLIHQWVPHAEASWNGPAWSISCEWLAYLFFPAVVLATAARGNASVAGSTAFLSLLTLGIFYQSGHDNRIVRIALEFPAGCMIYCLFRAGHLAGKRAASIIPAAVLGLAGVLLISSHSAVSRYWAVFPLALFVYGTSVDSGIAARLLGSRYAVLWGKASYSLYMTHVLTMMVLGKVAPFDVYRDANIWSRIAIGAVWISLFGLVALLMYRLVEEPARRWMHGAAARRKSEPAAACLAGKI